MTKVVAVVHELAEMTGKPYPEAGTYTRKNPLKLGVARVRPSLSVEIATTTPPEGGFTVRGKSTVLAGTFRYAYDSTTGGFTRPANPPGETTDATGNRATARERKVKEH